MVGGVTGLAILAKTSSLVLLVAAVSVACVRGVRSAGWRAEELCCYSMAVEWSANAGPDLRRPSLTHFLWSV